ncbi:MAG: glutamate racemase [bacterium]|nr:glutamate racemase [bacterium]
MSLGKIAIFDSGVGGLTVAEQVQQSLPGADIIYFGDTKYVPYGARPSEEVVSLIERICRYLVHEGAAVLVMACNTSSALAYESVCSWSPVPVIGIIEAAAKAAVRLSPAGRIGVISNALTASSGAYERAVRRYDAQAAVYPQGCPKLVPLAEQGIVSGPQAEAALREYIDPLLAHNIDTLVFGCTHYPFFRKTITRMYGSQLTLIDPALFVAEELRSLGWQDAKSAEGERVYRVSGDPAQFAQVAESLLGHAIGSVEKALD